MNFRPGREMLPVRCALAVVLGALLPGCDWMPGKPTRAQQWQAPHAVVDFEKLYAENCRGCHGAQGEISGAIALDNPMYLAVVPRETLRTIIANGVAGTAMIGFSEEHGGSLTEKQIDVLVEGISAWAKNPPSGKLPAYNGSLGDAGRGATAFATYCASCHGADGNGAKAGSVVHPAYVGLVSDQYLRTIVIAGRNDLGCPDFQSRVPGTPMSEEEISGVVAWLVSHRRNEFGQPLPLTQR
ncbi:MAG TPA: c-type cytochrome [Terrimicrobiaceae bacterium]